MSADLSKIVKEASTRCGVTSVVAGISGGADSTALLTALSIAKINVTAIHCNFNLRGAESDADENFVKALCESLNVPLEVFDFDVPEYASSRKISVEMACRELRYEAFRKVMSSVGADRIAVAHNANDQAETLLLNLMRGAGTSGLRAMREDSGEIFRPFINTPRSEIEDFLREKNLGWCTDSTNLESDYLRNFLRNDVIPLLETRWPHACKSLNRAASNLGSDESVLLDVERRLLPGDSYVLKKETIFSFCNPAWLIRKFAYRYGASDRQIREITDTLLDKSRQPGAYWKVKNGEIHLERDCIEYIQQHLSLPEITTTRHILTSELMERIRKSDSECLWTTLSPDQIEWRTPKTGDKLKLLGVNGSVLISKIMKDAHMSTRQKRLTQVAVRKSDGEIIGVPGLKRSSESLVDINCDKIVWEYRLKREH